MNRNKDCWYKKVCTYDFCTNCIRYAEMKYLMDNSGISKINQHPKELIADVDLEEYTRLATIKSNIVDFIESGNNLYICSQYTGNGKTSWALKLMLKYFNEIWAGNGFRVRGIFVNVPTLLLQLKNFSNPVSEKYRHDLLDCDLVIFDDIADVNISNYDYSNLLMIIDYRLQNEKSCIFTSNRVTKEQLEKSLGVRMTSRVWNTSEIIEFKGKDRRSDS